MRIQVIATEHVSRQARTYAEYRLFAALTHRTDVRRITGARVVLRRRMNGECGAVGCSMTVMFAGGPPLRIRAIGAHACAAIDRAVERLTASTRPDRMPLATMATDDRLPPAGRPGGAG